MPIRPDFQKFFFRLNLLLTGIVFFLLSPTVRIYRSWFPEKSDSLWLYPVFITLASGVLWFLASLSIPALIRAGILHERRKTSEESARFQGWERYRRILMPILITLFHLLVCVFFAAMIILFLRSEPFEKLFTNIP